MKLINVPLDRIRPNPWQTRIALEADHVLPLAEDIARNGLMHPPAGRLVVDNAAYHAEPVQDLEPFMQMLEGKTDWDPALYVQLAVGHNRGAAYDVLAYGPAHKFPELEGHVDGPEPDPGRYAHLPVQIAAYSDQQMANMAWSENAQRKDLTPLEEARAIQRVIDDFNWTQAEAAQHFGLARATVANKLRLLKLPGELLDHVHAGAISERAAGSLLTLYQLPDEIRQRLSQSNTYWTEERLRQEAVEGKPSDQIRNYVQNAISHVTRLLDHAPFPLDENIAEQDAGVRAANCLDCPLYIRVGDKDRCGDDDCYERKEEAWSTYRHTLIDTDLPIVDGDHWNHLYFEDNDHRRDLDAGRQILEDGCPHGNLALTYHPFKKRWDTPYLHPDDFPDFPVCCAGNAFKGCACLAAAKGEPVPQPDPQEIAENEAKQRWHREVQQPLAQRLAGALEAMNQDAWRLFVVHHMYWARGHMRDWTALCQALAAKTIEDKAGYAPWKKIRSDDIRNELQQWLADAGIEAEEDDPADDLARRLQRLTGWADGLAETMPTNEQLLGNLNNVEKLGGDFDEISTDLVAIELADSEELDGFLIDLDRLHTLFDDLLMMLDFDRRPTLAEFYEHMPNLLAVEPEVIAGADIGPAADWLLRYALAVATYRGDTQRAVILEAELNRLDHEKEAQEAICDGCGDVMEGADLITCSCGKSVCDWCYETDGHANHDTSAGNAALREMVQEMKGE